MKWLCFVWWCAAALLGVALGPAAHGQSVWIATEQAKLLASMPAFGDRVGTSVSILGDTAVSGALGYPQSGLIGAGAVFVFVSDGTGWSEQAVLVAPDPEAYANLGASVHLDGDTLIAGAYLDDQPGAVNAGSAYVWVRSGTTWTQQAELVASDAATFDVFGDSVGLCGDTALVGSSRSDHGGASDAGAAYEFVRSGTSWSERAKLVPSDPQDIANFGASLAFEQDRALIGAPHADGGVGAAYVFERIGTTWTEVAKLVPADQTPFGTFGRSVALGGDSALVGAPTGSVAGLTQAGAGYVFRRIAAGWAEEGKLFVSDPSISDFLGFASALYGDTAFLGAASDDHVNGSGANEGSVTVFARSGAIWTERSTIVASDAAAGDQFGNALDVQVDTLLVGAIGEDFLTGSMYVFELAPDVPAPYCTAGTSASGCRAALSASGAASATAPSGFQLTVSSVEGGSNGLFLIGAHGRAALPWGNGTSYQCLLPPLLNGRLLLGSGTSGACDGAAAQDFNAVWCPTCPRPGYNPGAGTMAQTQYWYRDPGSSSNQTTSLSDALEFLVGP